MGLRTLPGQTLTEHWSAFLPIGAIDPKSVLERLIGFVFEMVDRYLDQILSDIEVRTLRESLLSNLDKVLPSIIDWLGCCSKGGEDWF